MERAIISHAHSDHSRYGMKHYLAHHDSIPVMKLRLGADINIKGLDYNEPITINGVKVSLHPAGHVIGSAQIRVEYKGEVWVYTGDYKRENDGISTAFEPVPCHAFITESTFGLPVYNWEPQQKTFDKVNSWWRSNAERGLTSVLFAYSLGKAQRIIANVDHSIGPVLTHGAVENINGALREHGIHIPHTTQVIKETPKSAWEKGLVIAPSSAFGTPWMRKFQPFRTGNCSGWMATRGARRWMAVDTGFVMSDHCDWNGLNQSVKESGAERVFVTHGYAATYARWLREQYKLDAHEVKTEFEGDEGD